MHVSLPGAEDQVYFDSNSFEMGGQVVNLDITPIEIGGLDATSVSMQPNLMGVNFGDEFIVHDNFYLPATMSRELKAVKLRGGAGMHQIQTGGINLGGSSFLYIESEGVWEMLDELEAAYIYVADGEFRTNDIECTARVNLEVFSGGTGFVDLGSSLLNTRILEVIDENDISAENATISMINPGYLANQGIFQGAGLSYGTLICEHDIKIYDNNSFGSLHFLPGSIITLEAGTTQTADEIEAIGVSDANITIQSNTVGVQAMLEVAEGSVNGEYLVLQDNAAQGGATFTANFSIDNGNNSGWNIIENQPDDYYWVGGSGLWTDLSHWATTSGGAEFHTEAPGQLDDVFIDANSFTEAGEIELNTDINIHDIVVSDVPSGTELNHSNSGFNLFMHGSLTLAEDMSIYLATVRLVGDGDQGIYTGGNYLGDACTILLETDGSYTLESALNTDQLQINSGSLYADGNDIQIGESFETSGLESYYCDLSNCHIDVASWRPINTTGFIELSGTEIICHQDFMGAEFSYANLTFGTENPVSLSGDIDVSNLLVPAGAELIFEAGSTVSWETMEMPGTEESPIFIHTDEPGNEFFFQSATGQVDATYLNIMDNHAGGGAIYNAEFSNIGSNVLGWNDISGIDESNFYSPLIYPNPSKGILNVSCSGNELLIIYDLKGRKVATLQCGRNDLSDLKSGIYVAQDKLIGYRSKLFIE